MTTTFADYAAQQDARNTIQLNVTKWTLMLCDALKQNYIDYSIKSHNRSVERGDSVDYHQKQINELKNGKCDYDFTFESGRKYHKIIMDDGTQRSVHAFVDKKTGEVYKSASWKSPAKGVRYDLRIIEQREWLLQNADWASSYLYAK
jgi:phage-related protein